MVQRQTARNGHVNVCTVLLKNNADVNEKEKTDITPLLMAAQKTLSDICTVLPLSVAAQKGLPGVCSMLIQHSRNVKDKWENTATPLFKVAKNGHTDFCIVLLENNANTKKKMNKWCNTAIHDSAERSFSRTYYFT